MFLKDGIVYGRTAMLPVKVESVRILPDRILLITFNSGETRVFDATILTGPAFKGLENESVFKNPVIEHGVITWADGEIDCAPEYMYEHSYEYSYYGNHMGIQ